MEVEIGIFTLWHFYGGNGAMACGLCEVVKLFGVAKLFLGALLFILVPVSCGVLIPTYVSSLIYSRYRQVAPGYT